MVPGRKVKSCDAVCVSLWKRELGGNQGDSQVSYNVPPSGGTIDHREYGRTWGLRKVVLYSGRGIDRLHEAPPYRSIHQEAADDHSGEG